MGRPFVLFALAVVFPLLPHAFGQSVISARSGLVNYSEGVVFVDGQPLEHKAGMFPRLHEGSTLATESGRAEILLTPDTYFRLGADSSMRMISTDIDDTQVELLSGSAILDSTQAPDGAFVKIVYKDETIRPLKPGNYRIDADPAQLRVFEGEAEVTHGKDNPVTLQASQLMPLDGAPVVKRFTDGSDGLLDIWSSERGSLIASNIQNSQSITDPLLDDGSAGVPADLASYIGYLPPLPPAPAGGLNPYGYGYVYPSYTVLSPYPALATIFIPAYRPATHMLLYTPHVGGYGSIYTTRPSYGVTGYGIGSTYHPAYVSRPAGIAPRSVGIAPRPVGGVHVGAVHVGGHR